MGREQAPRRRNTSLYEVLQVSPRAQSEVIQASYRVLARQCHPDLNPGPAAAERMRALNGAYHVLRDSERRAQYDAQHTWLALAPSSGRSNGRSIATAPSRSPLDDRSMAAAGTWGFRGRLALLVVGLMATLTLLLWLILEILSDSPGLGF